MDASDIENNNDAIDCEMRQAQNSDLVEFRFLNFTNLDQITHPETKKRIRSHVMQRLQRELRSERQKSKSKEIDLDTSSLLESKASTRWMFQTAGSSKTVVSVPHPSDLGAGRSNPFLKYPIDMNLRAHELLDHLHGDTCPNFKTINNLGFYKIVEDDAGFRQILSTSSCHISSLQNKPESSEAIALSTRAIRSLSRRLADPAQNVDDGVVVTILAFACHTIMFKDFHGSVTHFNGLEEVIRRRGGISSLSGNPVLRIMIFWLDVNIAFLQNRAPRYSCPTDILPVIDPRYIMPSPAEILLKSLLASELVDTFSTLFATNRFMVSELATKNLWNEGLFAGLYIMPILSKLLSIDTSLGAAAPSIWRQEACRIGAILYLAGVRKRFGLNLATNVYIPKLKGAINGWDVLDFDNSHHILLWALVIGGIQSLLHEDHPWFISKLTAFLSKLGCASWDAVLAMVHDVLWVEGIFEDECEELQREISAPLWDPKRQDC